MTNVQAEIKDNVLTIKVDVSPSVLAKAPRSKTGKSNIVGSTNGFMDLDNGLKLSMNVIHK